jgi:hypothetical protein
MIRGMVNKKHATGNIGGVAYFGRPSVWAYHWRGRMSAKPQQYGPHEPTRHFISTPLIVLMVVAYLHFHATNLFEKIA